MVTTALSLDTASHPVNAIINTSDGRRIKFPKVKPVVGWASDAAWQAAAQTEHLNAVNQPMAAGRANATAFLASLV